MLSNEEIADKMLSDIEAYKEYIKEINQSINPNAQDDEKRAFFMRIAALLLLAISKSR